MNLIFTLLTVPLIVFQVILSAHVHKERTEDAWNSVHYDKDGSHNSEYDHEAILGSKKEAAAYDELTPEEAKRRLRSLVIKGGMDANGDGYVDHDELTVWILKSFESLAEEEGRERFEEDDSDKDGHISWEEHINANFDSDELQFKDNNEMIHEDKVLYKAADRNDDGKLSIDEFPAFNSPEDFPFMHDALFQLTMEKKDLNNDGLLDFNEFIRTETGEIPDKKSETYIVEKERFTNEFDVNRDGKLDKTEVLTWLIPNNKDTAESETNHLITTCDDDGDGKLSVEEIVNYHNVFVGSEATDFSELLHKFPAHDEF